MIADFVLSDAPVNEGITVQLVVGGKVVYSVVVSGQSLTYRVIDASTLNP